MDDPDHPLDIECCVHEIIEVIWKDRSIAIARGLERLCEVNAPDKKRKGRKKKQTDAELCAFSMNSDINSTTPKSCPNDSRIAVRIESEFLSQLRQNMQNSP